MNQTKNYIGNELDLFKDATNWKKYFSKNISEFINGDVLEIGAGIGINTPYLINNKTKSITCVEPDKNLFDRIKENTKNIKIEINYINGTIVNVNKKYETIIYIDVLEHIEDSRNEIELIKEKLNKNGKLIILVPAYNFLFSEFDKSIGHYRRYNKRILRNDINNKLKENKTFYLDSLGCIASLMNKLILKKNTPSSENIKFWDKIIIPFSKIFDLLIFKTIGKSLIGIYQNTDSE